MTDGAWLKQRFVASCVMGGAVALGLVLCALEYARHHSWLPVTSAVAMICGGGVFLNSTYQLAKRRTARTVPSHD